MLHPRAPNTVFVMPRLTLAQRFSAAGYYGRFAALHEPASREGRLG